MLEAKVSFSQSLILGRNYTIQFEKELAKFNYQLWFS